MSSSPDDPPKIIILMGVAGVGKTTVGIRLADRLGWTFLDADDFHPDANVEKMQSGVALTDNDRDGWLDRLRDLIGSRLASGAPMILACSALKASYRHKLTNGHEGVIFIYLRASRKVIEDRISGRTGHFFSAELLASQFAALEEPDDAVVVDAAAPVDEIVDAVVSELQPANYG